MSCGPHRLGKLVPGASMTLLATLFAGPKLSPICRAEAVLTPWAVVQMIYEETKGEAIIATGVGQHQMWAAQWYNYDAPRRWVSSGGLGSMGFGLPSAIGAAVAFDGTDGREKRVRTRGPALYDEGSGFEGVLLLWPLTMLMAW